MDHNIVEYPQSEKQHNHYHYHYPQSRERMEATSFDEQLAAALGEDFPYPLSSESNTSSPQLDFDIYTDFIESLHPPRINNYNNDDAVALMSLNSVQSGAGYMDVPGLRPEDMPQQNHDNQKNKEEEDDDDDSKKAVAGNKKRKREPSQVLDHIMAERKRRELLSQRFIALSAIVPGLKKTDKTTVLGEAIKYMKQLQEKVKVFEEVSAKRTVESVVVVKKSHLVVDDEAVDDNDSSCTIDDGNKSNDLLPEIEVKVSDKTLLFRVYCEKQKGCLGRLFGELEKHDDISIVSSSIIPFGTLGSDITIVVQKEKGFNNKNVKDLIRPLRSALLLHSQGPRTKST